MIGASDGSRDLYSVSRLTTEVRAVLDGSFPLLWVQGEISNLARPSSGHLYFTLKDAVAQVRCAMFKPKRILLGFAPDNGQSVVVRARVTLYEPRGDFQLVVEHMEPGGEGALRLELERLKRRLAAEGLFDETAKRPLPSYPRQVGLISSPSGAALRDLLAVLRRRFAALPVIIYPAQVQGATAPDSLCAALALANARAECDVLILARGGGSLEDLGAFNDERLARAIRASAIPVITGIGHAIDLSIADLAADRSAPTPSAAAELVAPSAEHLRQRVTVQRTRLLGSASRRRHALRQRLDGLGRQLMLLHPATRLQQRAQRLDRLEQRLLGLLAGRLARLHARSSPLAARLLRVSPMRRLGHPRETLAMLERRLARAGARLTESRHEHLSRAAAGLEALSPLATLARGYAIVTRLSDGAVLHAAEQVQPGTRIQARLARGALRAVVEATADPD
ncbi:MAG: exodeoxyribonuclease VII large subunit [Sphingobacteriia bacterium]|nr:exodeoxyribonuclease VII large subunit [Sphingobacteriia bacterium]NCC39729.1 exodeoxyribonuclease VII large subunit [Gammaproteobacteria bacterium]